MVFHHNPARVLAMLMMAICLAGPSWPGHTEESNTAPVGIHFETPSFRYCEITDSSPSETNLTSRVRQHGEPYMLLVGLFADCEQKRYWHGNPAKEPTRFGAAFLHKFGGGLRPMPEPRAVVLQKLAARLDSWDQAPARLAFERMTKGAIDIKVEHAQLMAATPDAVFIGFTATTPASGSDRTIAGISAISLIKQIPVSLHLYRNADTDRTVHTLLLEAKAIMHKWLALNDETDPGSSSVISPGAQPAAHGVDHGPLQLKSATNPVRDQLLALLENGEFQTLSRELANRQAAFDNGQLSESQLLNAYLTFERADPDLMKKLDAWIDAYPSDYAPRVARGLYNVHLGWVARGTSYVQKTARDRLDRMTRHFEAAAADFDMALTRNPKVGIAWQNLILIAVAKGEPTEELYTRGIEQIPSSFALREVYAFSFHPDWGGGLNRSWWARGLPWGAKVANRNVRWLKFYESLQTDSAHVAALKPIVNSPHYQAAKQEFGKLDYAAAARELIDAINDGDESRAFAAKGRKETAKGDYAAAVRSFDQALQEGPYWSNYLQDRANALRGLGNTMRNLQAYRSALADFQKLLTVNPYDPELLGDIVLVLWDISSIFPNETATTFEQTWQTPASCKPNSEPAKRFTLIRMAMQDTNQMPISCTVEALLDRGMFYGRDDFNIREMRGRHLLFSMQSPSRAAVDFAATLEIDDGFPHIWGHYATALHEIGDCRAMAAYRKYLEMCKNGKCPPQSVAINRNQFSELTLSGICGS